MQQLLLRQSQVAGLGCCSQHHTKQQQLRRPFSSPSCSSHARGVTTFRQHVSRHHRSLGASGRAAICRAAGDDKEGAPGSSDQQQQPSPDQAPTSSSSSGGSTSTATDATGNPTIAGADSQQLQVSKEVIETLRNKVFGFDTMWVTSVDNYQQDGVVFKGNVRNKDPSAAYAKMKQRLADVMGDKWQIFLLQDKEEKPTAVLLPSDAREGVLSPVTEVWLFLLFGLASIISSLQSAGVPVFQFLTNPFYTEVSQQDVLDALPLAGLFLLTLVLHEAGHRVAASKRDVSLYLPLIIPAGFGFIGSFGGITRFKGFVKDRPTLLDISMAGPLWGTAASAALLAVGLGLTVAGLGDITIDSPAFADSFIVGLLGQFLLGEALANPEIQVSSLFVAGWAGLTVNALNLLPTGELDGGRMALGLFGRRAYQAVGVLTVIGLAVTSFFNPLAFYWVVLILALQRGPVLPCQEELSAPQDDATKKTAYALLLLPLLVLLPYPVELLVAMQDLPDPIPF